MSLATEETMKHKVHVSELLRRVAENLIERGTYHDNSKLESPEVETFEIYTHKLKGMTYGSDEYKECLAAMKPALDHHYAHNAHHPEHYLNGIRDMTLLDLVEMFCDWKAASARHNDGNILTSIQKNKERFKYSDELEAIFNNTAKMFEGGLK